MSSRIPANSSSRPSRRTASRCLRVPKARRMTLVGKQNRTVDGKRQRFDCGRRAPQGPHGLPYLFSGVNPIWFCASNVLQGQMQVVTRIPVVMPLGFTQGGNDVFRDYARHPFVEQVNDRQAPGCVCIRRSQRDNGCTRGAKGQRREQALLGFDVLLLGHGPTVILPPAVGILDRPTPRSSALAVMGQ